MRQEPEQVLGALADAFAEPAARPYRQARLVGVVAAEGQIALRIEEDQNAFALIIFEQRPDAGQFVDRQPAQQHDGQDQRRRQIAPVQPRRENHHRADRNQDDGAAEIRLDRNQSQRHREYREAQENVGEFADLEEIVVVQ
ncbi:hypothetical protein SDC9_102388 [bioreactor metagenome]|uniref:Uncharacterized protein n=1 Tax=bioreactor metagenome TaxID=1076179 RepID=A0A645ATF1_9ZZZZ